MTILDASAMLAFAQNELGAEIVEVELKAGARCSAANWSEVAQVTSARAGSFDLTRALLVSYGLVVEPVTREDGELAARLWRRGSGLSLADRLCLALGERLDTAILTADRAWGESTRIRQLR